MSEIKGYISFSLDAEGFFRRECPFCRKEFKVLLEKEELSQFAQKGIESFMIESKEETNNSQESDSYEDEFVCPYCGQRASADSWWTQEQLSYIHIFGENIMAQIINDNLIRPLQGKFQKHDSFISFQGKEMQQREPWISPELSDMKIFNLPCCERKIKIDDNWNKRVHCFFCGFPHE